jgi:histidinol-phosphatase (PHP family)
MPESENNGFRISPAVTAETLKTLLPFLDTGCDAHVHTQLCGHAVGTMEQYVEAAIACGLNRIIFLEHLEDGIAYFHDTWLSEDKFDLYFNEGEKLQKRYAGKIDIGLGVECGYNPDRLENICRRLARRNWDATGISCHYLKFEGLRHHLNLFSRNASNLKIARQLGVNRVISRYLSTLTEAVDSLPGSKVCHLDGVLRWIPGIDIFSSHPEQVETLLETIKKRSMSVELNTSGFSIRDMQFPADNVLARVLHHGIPLELGSDAHQPGDVGRFFARFG